MTTDPYARRMARIDGCPECVGNYTAPVAVKPTTDGFLADYRCEDCDHQWTTGWSDDRMEWML